MVQDKLNPLARRDKPEPLFRRLMLQSFTRLLSKTTSLAEINNVSQKGAMGSLGDVNRA